MEASLELKTNKTIRPLHYSNTNSSILMEDIRKEFNKQKLIYKLECFNAMLNMFEDPEEVRGFLRGNIFKYNWRYVNKNNIEDLEKMKVYLNWLLILENTIKNHINNKGLLH